MNFSLHYSIKYFKNNNYFFPSILNIFSVNASFSGIDDVINRSRLFVQTVGETWRAIDLFI